MPLVKRKIVELVPPPKAKANEDPEVFYLQATGEIFSDYDSYANRLTFYNQRLFQCELTGRVNLTFFEASESEKQEAITLHKKFPEPLKGPVLRSVQFKVTGRLDNLVDLVFDRFKDRFFASEAVFVELQGDRYYARIKEVFPPKAVLKSHQEAVLSVSDARADGVKRETNSGSSRSEVMDEDEPHHPAVPLDQVIHRLGADLELGPAEANALDDPMQYIYRIQLVDDQGSFTGSLMEASADKLSRDRLAFSKTILRKYIRDCVLRDASVGAPWVVKTWLAEKYRIPTSPSDETLQKNEMIKDAKLSKRKKAITDGDESAARKKPKIVKTSEAADSKKTAAAEKKRLAEEEKAKEEEKLKAERERKKNLKYPIEDLDLDPISTRELKFKVEGELPRRKQRPIPIRGAAALPVPAGIFEDFMVSYYFLVALGKPLCLSVFSLDDFEQALRHQTHDPPCALIAEIHSVLLNAIIRDGSLSKELASVGIASRTPIGAAVKEANGSVAPSENDDNAAGPSRAGSTFDELEVNGHSEGTENVAVEEILRTAKEIGKGSERRVLRPEDGRDGWESQLVGFLARRASRQAFPRLVGILSHLTGIEHSEGYIDSQWVSDTYLGVEDRYPVLALEDKVRIINFLCELAVMTKPIKLYFEECEAQVTELRKEKIELGREKRKLAEEREIFEGGQKKDEEKKDEEKKEEDGGEAEDGSTAMPVDDEGELGEGADSDSEKDELESDDDDEDRSAAYASDAGSDRLKRTFGSSRQEKLREKAMIREAEEAARVASRAKEREAHRAKLLENKQINAERKRFDDEEARLWKREEAMEREFRKVLLAPRMIPLGRDRFYERYWWFDGVGSTSLAGGGGSVLYQTGRLFVQGPSEEDWSLAKYERKRDELETRKADELGEEGNLRIDEWAVYTEPEQLDELLSWLRAKGHRENHLKSQLLKFRYYIQGGMRKRNADLQGGWRDQLETRRSARSKSENAASRRASYMAWKNSAAEKSK